MTHGRHGGYLVHPVVLAALGLWVLNDHVLKQTIPGVLTGKLSDVVSLVVFPLIATAACEMVLKRRSARVLAFWLVATGAVMASINTLDLAAFAYRVGLGAAQWPFLAARDLVGGGPLPALREVHLTMDVTDLLTLPALSIAYWAHGKRTQAVPSAVELSAHTCTPRPSP